MRLVLIDDQALVRQGIQQLLAAHGDFVVVGEAATPEQGLGIVRALQPDLVLLEVRLHIGDPVRLIKTLHEEYPAMRVVVLTVSEDDDDLLRALRAGADGFISKSVSAGPGCRLTGRLARRGVPVALPHHPAGPSPAPG